MAIITQGLTKLHDSAPHPRERVAASWTNQITPTG